MEAFEVSTLEGISNPNLPTVELFHVPTSNGHTSLYFLPLVSFTTTTAASFRLTPPLPSDMVKERVITVEYLEPSMSRELVGKFPDNSAFDFEYSQSSIWSPLLPRDHHAPAPLLCRHTRKKLLYGSPVILRKVKAKFSDKKKQHKKKRSAIGKNLEFTPIPSPKLVRLLWNLVYEKIDFIEIREKKKPHLAGMEESVESSSKTLQDSREIAIADGTANLMNRLANSFCFNLYIFLFVFFFLIFTRNQHLFLI